MNDDDGTKFDNLSNMARDLEEIEGRDGGVTDPARANEVRECLIAAMHGYVKSLYEFAEQLNRYHKLFKAKKTATVAMERIAIERECSSRTLYRLPESFKKSQQLPLIFMDALHEEGIDPVRGKNHSLVETLTAVPVPATQEEAKASLKAARTKVLKMAPGGRKARNVPAADATQVTPTTQAFDATQKAQTTDNSQATLATDAPETTDATQTTDTTQATQATDATQATQATDATQTTQATDATQTTQATDAIQTTQTTDTTQTVQTIGTAQIADREINEFAANIVRMLEERFGGYDRADRDKHIRSVLERVVNALYVDVRELRIEGRPSRARKPAKKAS